MSTPGSRVDHGTAEPGRDPSLGLPDPLTQDPQVAAELLRIAREAVTAAVTRRHARSVQAEVARGSTGTGSAAHSLSPEVSAALERPGAAFVTLTEHGSLRGCIGSLAFDEPLGRAVASAGASAAVRDPRFMPVTERELPSIHIDVSVLGPAVPLRDPLAFRPGIDGIIVARDGRRGLFLPEVATDQGWGAEEMLDAVCEKAGLDRNAWHDPRTRLFAFRTVRVSEPEATTG
jgi:AmmeMemoRadiSam system protein A